MIRGPLCTRTLIGLVAVAAVALTGCTSDIGPDDSTPANNSTPSSDSTVSGAPVEEVSPLSKYFNEVLYGLSPSATPEEQKQFYWEQNRKTEELIATCMTEQGFTYVPDLNLGGSVVDGPERHLDDRGWVERYGYGVLHDAGQDQEQTPAPVNPNEAYVNSLTEAEQAAYYEAMDGKDQPSDDDDDEYDWRTAGCYGAAQHEAQGENPWQLDENKPLFDALSTFYAALREDPAFTQLDADWAACMTEKGFADFAKQDDAARSVHRLLDTYWESVPDDAADKDPSVGTLKDPAFAELADQELKLAVADLDCREKIDYRRQKLKIQFAAEEQFIADHQEELDALIAQANQTRR